HPDLDPERRLRLAAVAGAAVDSVLVRHEQPEDGLAGHRQSGRRVCQGHLPVHARLRALDPRPVPVPAEADRPGPHQHVGGDSARHRQRAAGDEACGLRPDEGGRLQAVPDFQGQAHLVDDGALHRHLRLLHRLLDGAAAVDEGDLRRQPRAGRQRRPAAHAQQPERAERARLCLDRPLRGRGGAPARRLDRGQGRRLHRHADHFGGDGGGLGRGGLRYDACLRLGHPRDVFPDVPRPFHAAVLRQRHRQRLDLPHHRRHLRPPAGRAGAGLDLRDRGLRRLRRPHRDWRADQGRHAAVRDVRLRSLLRAVPRPQLVVLPALRRLREKPMSHFLDRLTYFSQPRESFAGSHGVITGEDRTWEDAYRNRWAHDKVVRSTHGVNCTGSCSWKIYVKGGIVTWETQQTDYPRTRWDMPNHEPRGCARGASYSWYLYSANRVKYPLVRGRLLKSWREARLTQDPVAAWASIVESDAKRRDYQSIRGLGGFVRSSWDEVNEIVAAANVYTIKKHGPDRVIGFSPI